MGRILWFTGNTGAGKSTLAKKYASDDEYCIILDADEIRQGINSDLGLSAEDRRQNNIRIAHLAKLLANQGFTVYVAVIAPTKQIRDEIKEICNCEFCYVVGGAPDSDRTPYECPLPGEFSFTVFGNLKYNQEDLEDRPKYDR